MRVALISPVYPPYRGGIGAVAANDARLLRARGAEVTVFTPEYQGALPEEHVTRLGGIFSYGNAAITPGLFFRLRKFDLLHLHYPCYGMDIFVLLASVVWRIPLVVTYHMKTYAPDWRNMVFLVHRAVIEPWVLRFAKCVCVSTFDYAQWAGVRHPKLMELPFGVNTQIFAPGEEKEYREAWKIPEEVPVMIFVGGLDRAHYFKGLDVLLRACAYLPPGMPFRLLVVGDGSERSAFETLAKSLGLADRVIFLGGVSKEDLPRAYRIAHFHVLPSRDQGEAFGLVTLEAGASGLPSVVSNLPGMRMLVDPTITGMRVQAGDGRALSKALQFLLTHKKEREIMGLAARRRALEYYDENKVADRLFQAYKGLVL